MCFLNLTIIHLFKHFGLLGLLYLIYLVVFSLVLLVCPRAVTEFLTILCNLIQIIRIFIFLNSGIQLIQPILPPLTSSTFWIVIHTVLKQRSMDSYNLCILVYPFKHSQIHKHLGPFNFLSSLLKQTYPGSLFSAWHWLLITEETDQEWAYWYMK